MIEITTGRLQEILHMIARNAEWQSRETFLKESKSFFLAIGDDAIGTNFKTRVATFLEGKSWNGLDVEDVVLAAQRLNDSRISFVVARALPASTRKFYFPEMTEDKLNELGGGAPAGAGGATTTANVGAYAVPLGQCPPSNPKCKKKKKKRK